MNSLNSEASILPRRMSAALKRKDSSWARVILGLLNACSFRMSRWYNKLLDDLRIVLAVVKKCNRILTTIVHQHLLS